MGVRGKLYLLLGVCFLGFICSFTADRVGKQYTGKYRTLEALATNAYVELLQARREEKNFLIRLDPAYIESVFSHADKVKTDIEQLSGLDDAINAEARQALGELAAYRKGFEELASIERVKGFTEHEGLMRDFVYAARDLDDKFAPVTDKDFQILLLTIRRHADQVVGIGVIQGSGEGLQGFHAVDRNIHFPVRTENFLKNFSTGEVVLDN